MNLQPFIDQILATKKPVGTGQCGELVDLWLVQGYGNHTEYPNAIDYWNTGIPGFIRTTNPQPGDIACYNAHGIYTEGHIAIYAGNGQVFEQNADPDGSLPHIYPRANTWLLGYLTKEGAQGMTWDDIKLFKGLLGLAVNDGDKGFVGDDPRSFMFTMVEGQEYKNYIAGLKTNNTQLNVVINGVAYAPKV